MDLKSSVQHFFGVPNKQERREQEEAFFWIDKAEGATFKVTQDPAELTDAVDQWIAASNFDAGTASDIRFIVSQTMEEESPLVDGTALHIAFNESGNVHAVCI